MSPRSYEYQNRDEHILTGHAVQEPAFRNQKAALAWIGDFPVFPAVPTAGQPVQFGFFTINVVAVRAKVLVPAFAESHEDFIVPHPDPVIGRPAAEAPLFGIDLHMFDIFRPQLTQCLRGESKSQ